MKKSIVTKTGDKGITFLSDGQKVPKNHIVVKTYGEIDELNSLLGLTICYLTSDYTKSLLEKIQNHLFQIGAQIMGFSKSMPKNFEIAIKLLETNIRSIEPKLPKLNNFILPGGSKGSSYLHLTRTVCRRVERSIVELHFRNPLNPSLLIFFNRFSDLLFLLARFENHQNKVKEIIWQSSEN